MGQDIPLRLRGQGSAAEAEVGLVAEMTAEAQACSSSLGVRTGLGSGRSPSG